MHATFPSYSMRKCAFTLTIIGMSLIACVTFAGCKQPKADMTAGEFLDRFSKDPVATNQQFKDQFVSIRGTVLSIGATIFSSDESSCVSLIDNSNDKTCVWCTFSSATIHQTQRLRVGDIVVIRGVFYGEQIAGLGMKECSVIRP